MYSYVKYIYRFIFDLGILIGFEGVIVLFVKFLNVNGVCLVCVELFDVGVWVLLLIVNIEFLDDELLEFFFLVVFEGVFWGWVIDFKGIVIVFFDEGVGGVECFWRVLCFFCFGEVGVEWIIWEVGKVGILEWKVGGFLVCVKGEMGRMGGCGFLGRDEL